MQYYRAFGAGCQQHCPEHRALVTTRNATRGEDDTKPGSA